MKALRGLTVTTSLAVGETVILLHLPPTEAGVTTGMERESVSKMTGSPMATPAGCRGGRRLSLTTRSGCKHRSQPVVLPGRGSTFRSLHESCTRKVNR